MVNGRVRALLAASLFCAAVVLSTWTISAGGITPPWVVQPSPNPSTGQQVQLYGISCTSSTFCVAVGSQNTQVNGAGTFQTLIEVWTGGTWTVATSPNEGTASGLQSVACLNSADCVAVGYSYTSAVSGQTLIEQWDGTQWSIVPSPNSGTNENILWGVSCFASTTSSVCQAVGYAYNGTFWQTLALSSTAGGPWTLETTPDKGTSTNGLISVSCSSIQDCDAAGLYYNRHGTQRTLVESWNGSTWSASSSPNVSSDSDFLQGISCPTTTSCVAVGNSVDGTTSYNLVERWNGSAWTISTSPTPSRDDEVASSVSCARPTKCAEVGYYVTSSTAIETLVESWNGASWTITGSADPGGQNALYSVSCSSRSFCDSAGNVDGSTLIETGR